MFGSLSWGEITYLHVCENVVQSGIQTALQIILDNV